HYLRNPHTMTAKLGRLLKDVSEHAILLSATPVHLKSDDLYYLLNLIDEDTFDSPRVFDTILEANRPLIRARDALMNRSTTCEQMLNLLLDAESHPLLRGNRQLNFLIENAPDEEQLKDKNYLSRLSYRLESINLLSNP
ncbi:MAG: DEAD/DEAH box helicase, partial [Deferribacteres bacterium]|nr:DEAD/DEAH box helicase [Deferribacteres bacterium]